MPTLWPNPDAVVTLPKYRVWPAADATISRQLVKGGNGYVWYAFGGTIRRKMEDRGQYDDSLNIKYWKGRVDQKQLVYDELPNFIESFDPYYAFIEKMYFGVWIGDAMPESIIDRRQGLACFSPVFYADTELCQRAFGCGPEEAARLLDDVVESTRILKNGLYVVVSSTVNPVEIDIANDARIREVLAAAI